MCASAGFINSVWKAAVQPAEAVEIGIPYANGCRALEKVTPFPIGSMGRKVYLPT